MKTARLKFRVFPLVALLAVSIAAGPAGLLGQGLPTQVSPFCPPIGLSSRHVSRVRPVFRLSSSVTFGWRVMRSHSGIPFWMRSPLPSKMGDMDKSDALAVC